jgi:hypothetical protein
MNIYNFCFSFDKKSELKLIKYLHNFLKLKKKFEVKNLNNTIFIVLILK